MKKLLIKNPTERKEALALLNIPASEYNDFPKLYPAVWLVVEPSMKGETGELIDYVGMEDFETPDNILKARAIVEWLNDPKYEQGFPVELLPTVEQYVRKLGLIRMELSSTAAQLEKEKRAAQHMQERMKNSFIDDYLSMDYKITEARVKAAAKMDVYDERLEEAAKMDRLYRSLISAINSIQVTMSTQLSRLNHEYKQIHYNDVGA